MKTKLTQLESNHNKVRTKEIIVYSWSVPTVGRYFSAMASPLKSGMLIRIFNSSKVLSVEKKGNTYFFNTENSKYKLELDYKPKTWEV